MFLCRKWVSHLSIWATRNMMASFSLFRLEPMKLFSSNVFLSFSFHAHALFTRSDTSADFSTLSVTFENSSTKEKYVLHPSRFETLNKFSVEMYEVFWKSPKLIFKGQRHSLQLSVCTFRVRMSSPLYGLFRRQKVWICFDQFSVKPALKSTSFRLRTTLCLVGFIG